MKTKAHWEECKELKSYIFAQKLALQIRETYKNKKAKGLKVLDKEKSRAQGIRADASIIWEEGPENWAKEIEINAHGIYCEVINAYTITFYDI